MGVLRAANAYVDREQPWKASKDAKVAERLPDVLYTLAEAIRFSSALVSPVLPKKAAAALAQLGAPSADDLRKALVWGVLEPGTGTARGEILFPRIEEKTVAANPSPPPPRPPPRPPAAPRAG